MNIVFDIGNVLLRWDPRFLYRKIFADEKEMEWFLAHVANSAWNLEQDRGRSFAEAVRDLTIRHPEHAEAIAAYDTRWPETLPHAIEESVAILEELRARGTPLYAITNFNGEKFRETRARFAFLRHFRDVVVSGDEGLVKPDPAIYRLLIKRNDLDPSQCLFIDDSEANVEGAKDCGMQVHHFRSAAGLRQALSTASLL